MPAACLAAALLCASRNAAAQEPATYEVKAAFLTNFAKFAEWPPDTLLDGAPMTFCVMGDEDVASAIERLKSRHGPGRQFRVLRLKVDILSHRQESALQACHVLYASGIETKLWPVLLAAIEGKPLFSVSDSPGFAERGGLAALYVELKRMRFAINVDTMRRSGLHLSAALLSLAKIVKDDPTATRYPGSDPEP